MSAESDKPFDFDALLRQTPDLKPYQFLQKMIAMQARVRGILMTVATPEQEPFIEEAKLLLRVIAAMKGQYRTVKITADGPDIPATNCKEPSEILQMEQTLLNARQALTVQSKPALLATIRPIVNGKLEKQIAGEAKILQSAAEGEDAGVLRPFIEKIIASQGFSLSEATLPKAVSKFSVTGDVSFKFMHSTEETHGTKIAFSRDGAALIYQSPPMAPKKAQEYSAIAKQTLGELSAIIDPTPASVKNVHDADKGCYYVIAPKALIARAQVLFSVDQRLSRSPG